MVVFCPCLSCWLLQADLQSKPDEVGLCDNSLLPWGYAEKWTSPVLSWLVTAVCQRSAVRMSLPRHHILRFCEIFLIHCTAWVKVGFFFCWYWVCGQYHPTRPGFPSDPALIFVWWQLSDVSLICLFTLAWCAEPWPTNSSAFIWQSLTTSELCYLRRKKSQGQSFASSPKEICLFSHHGAGDPSKKLCLIFLLCVHRVHLVAGNVYRYCVTW